MRILGTLALSAGILALAAPGAHAATLLFELSGSRNASFMLDSTPTPSSFTAFQTNFINVGGTFGGVPGTASLINFGGEPFIARLNIVGTPLGFTQFSGPRLFSGPTSAPVFAAGTFELFSIVSGRSTLTISEAPGMAGPIPEPATWALLISGFGLVGWAARRRRAAAGLAA